MSRSVVSDADITPPLEVPTAAEFKLAAVSNRYIDSMAGLINCSIFDGREGDVLRMELERGKNLQVRLKYDAEISAMDGLEQIFSLQAPYYCGTQLLE